MDVHADNPPCFRYGQTELDHLRARDPRLATAIDRIGLIRREVQPDLFHALVHSIIGQQISTKAQVTIWGKVQARFPGVSPEVMASCALDELQGVGITFRKAGYIQDIARSIVEGRTDLHALAQLNDGALCHALSQFRGIGVWTAEMLMLFSLQRPDIVSYGDLAILRGMRMLYRHRAVTPQLFARYRRRYSPYGSTASLYLWAIAGGALPELTDPGRPGKSKK